MKLLTWMGMGGALVGGAFLIWQADHSTLSSVKDVLVSENADAQPEATKSIISLDEAKKLTALLNEQLQADNRRGAADSYAKLLDVLPQFTDPREYSEVAGSAVEALLAIKNSQPISGEEGLTKARALIPFITSSPQRENALRALAVAEGLLHGADDVKAALGDENTEVQAAFFQAKAKQRLAEGDLEGALWETLRMPFAADVQRNGLLSNIVEVEMVAQDDYLTALRAVAGMHHFAERNKRMKALLKDMIAHHELTRAQRLAAMMDDPKEASDGWRALAEAYRVLGYPKRAEFCANTMLNAIDEISDETQQKRGFIRAAKYLADAGEVDQSLRLLGRAEGLKEASYAYAALAKKEAEQDHLPQAAEYYALTQQATQNVRSRTARALVNAYLRQGKLAEAQAFFEQQTDMLASDIREAGRSIFLAMLAASKSADAKAFLSNVKEPALQMVGRAMLREADASGQDEATQKKARTELIAALAALSEPAQRSWASAGLVSILSEAGDFTTAKAMAADLKGADATYAISHMVEAMVLKEQADAAVKYVQGISDVAQRDDALSSLALVMAQQQDVQDAVRTAKQISGMTLRVTTLRRVAEIQAQLSDFYHLLHRSKGAKEDVRAVQNDHNQPMILPSSLMEKKNDSALFSQFEAKTVDLVKSSSDDLLLRDAPTSTIGQHVPNIHKIERLKMNASTVRELVPQSRYFIAARSYYQNSPFNLKFHFAAGNSDFVRRQKTALPDMITVQQGVVDLALLADMLREQGFGDYLERSGRTYLLRRPLVIGPEATLVISAADTEELKLSQEAGAYIVNGGHFYAVDTKITAWSEEKNAPALVDKEPHSFRPFFASWSRSISHMANTDFTGFGYTNSKSYGITISSGPRQFEKMQSRNLTRPTGIIVDNSFRNFLYGFYSYEADDVVLVGNEYVDNYTYGIDPHDRSRWLTIAYNTVYDTHKKHGIIISREVNDSAILGNITFDNHGSGMMTDRFSTGTMIYANTAFENGGDGLTVFESSCKVIASNRLFDNKRAGIRVRNSMDVGIYFNELRGNLQAAVQGYVVDLQHDPAHQHRDFELDPYTDVTALSMVGNWIERNGVGIMASDVSALFMRANHFQSQSPKLLRGTWEKVAPRIFARSQLEGEGLLITNRCVKGTIAVRHHCSFRDQGFFPGDGQDSLVERIDENYCAMPADNGTAQAPVDGAETGANQ